MSPRTKRILVRVGVVPIAIALIAHAAIVVVSVLEGSSGFIIQYTKNGRPSFFVAVAYVPVLVIAFVVGIIYLGRWLSRFYKRRA